jgi:hypothetical protein
MLTYKDLVPRPATFKLKGKVYRLRPFNLDDEEWLRQAYGEKISKVFTEQRWFDIVRIAFHQLLPHDRALFPKTTVRVVNEEGDEAEHSVGGFRRMALIVESIEEKNNILRALMETLGVSRPIQKKLEQAFTEEAEAQLAEQKKKRDSLAGSKLSTSSPQSTGGRRRKSAS